MIEERPGTIDGYATPPRRDPDNIAIQVGASWSTVKPLFEQHVTAAIERRTKIFKERGANYGDTWANCRFLKMRAVAKALDLEIPPEYFRALATAAFVDMKDERLNGGWNFDHLDDGANYLDFLNEEMRQLLAK